MTAVVVPTYCLRISWNSPFIRSNVAPAQRRTRLRRKFYDRINPNTDAESWLGPKSNSKSESESESESKSKSKSDARTRIARSDTPLRV